MDDRRRIVRAGYDEVAEAYLADRTREGGDVDALVELLARLSPGARVLDAGCGAGVPVAARLVEDGFETVGLDFSVRQLQLGDEHVDGWRPVQGDLSQLPFPDAAFDAVVSFYAVIHVPRSLHPSVFGEIHRVLRPGGWALLCLGAGDLPEDDDPDSWLGARMYWSHYDAPTNLQLLRDAGFTVDDDREVPDPMGHRGHLFARVRRAGA
jgi:ubiquinone/menaquinone biosynthesis C-methylase UbiE